MPANRLYRTGVVCVANNAVMNALFSWCFLFFFFVLFLCCCAVDAFDPPAFV